MSDEWASDRELLDWTKQVFKLFNDDNKKAELIRFFRKQVKRDDLLREKINKAITELRNLKFSTETQIDDMLSLNSMEQLLYSIVEERNDNN